MPPKTRSSASKRKRKDVKDVTKGSVRKKTKTGSKNASKQSSGYGVKVCVVYFPFIFCYFVFVL